MSLSPQKMESLSEQIARGGEAERMLQAFGGLHQEREQAALNELITFFRTQPWDERTAIRYIAALSENRAQREELELRARRAVRAREQLATASTDAAEGE